MDSYQGSIYDPVTLHKYLYANANPVMYTDPSGYMSLPECSIVTCIQNTINYVHQIRSLTKIIKWADAMCTVYDTAMEIRNVILGGGSIVDVIGALLKGDIHLQTKMKNYIRKSFLGCFVVKISLCFDIATCV